MTGQKFRDFSINPAGKMSERRENKAVKAELDERAKTRRAIEDLKERQRLAEEFGVPIEEVDI